MSPKLNGLKSGDTTANKSDKGTEEKNKTIIKPITKQIKIVQSLSLKKSRPQRKNKKLKKFQNIS